DHGGGRWSTRVFDHYRELGEAELPGVHKLIADAGYYAYETTVDGVRALEESPAAVDAIFRRRITETVEGWLRLAEERLDGSDVLCFMAPGNDDHPFVDDLLRTSPRVIKPEGSLVEPPGGCWSPRSSARSSKAVHRPSRAWDRVRCEPPSSATSRCWRCTDTSTNP